MTVPDIGRQYDTIGPDYIVQRERERHASAVSPSKAFITAHLLDPEHSSILDVGCGDGGDLLEYQALGFKEINGVDSSPVMVDAARKLLGGIALVKVASWNNLPFADSSNDYVVGRSSIHYVEDVDVAYNEAARVLKPSGRLIIVSPHPLKVKSTVMHGGREYVQNPIFDGEVTITYPRHTMGDYFSVLFNSLFELDERKEIAKTSPTGTQEPGQIAFAAHLR